MIKIKNLYKIYHQNRPNEMVAIKNVNLEITTSGLYLIRGASGSGKSTLLSIIGALSKPTSGEVVVLGENVAKLPDHFASRFRQEKLGFIFQQFHLLPQMSALENVLLPLIPTDISFDEATSKAYELLQKLNISHRATTPARLLSGGEQQRVAIARALINDPKLIIADEPTANLDQKNKESLLDILQTLKNEGKTIVISTHDEAFDKINSTDIFLMQDGEIKN